jgi:hypothetical protein
MKTLIFLVSVFLTSHTVFSQTKPEVEYKGGIRALGKMMRCTDEETDDDHPLVKTTRCFLVEFSLDTIGRMKDDITFIANIPLDSMPSIMTFMKKTEGNWVNHSGQTVHVLFPFTFLYDDGSGAVKNKRCDLVAANFVKWTKSKTVILEPLVTTIYPTTHDRGITVPSP